ncbi:MAG: hypothetical protein K0Q79_3215 [Flavipsychrobacter sp.]|jgi:hypothetical protein|nr:hypothetical protein [Flavipsychrobacter sp.]
MKRQFLSAALILISLTGKTFAQESKITSLTKTESNFNMQPSQVNNRHWVYLPKDGKMIIELHNTHNYTMLSSLEPILNEMMKNIAFYKDSLNAAGNVRIDYAYATYQPLNKIRFKKYAPDGDLFVVHRNDLAKLKIEQDTIRIVFENSNDQPTSWDSKAGARVVHRDIPAQITFCLNNYEDLNGLLANKGTLNHIIDTLIIASNPKNKKAFPFFNTTSIAYRPFDTGNHSERYRFKKLNNLWENENDMNTTHGILTIDGSLGLGVIRSMFAPMAEMGIEINDRWNWVPNKRSFIRASATPYFFFEKGLGNKIIVNDNWFATLEFGTQKGDKRSSVGIGYLFAEKGNYFQNATGKVFAIYTLSKRVSLCPEIIFTNNFKQAYPGVTLRF